MFILLTANLFFCRDLNVPFPQWDTDRIALWLHSMGLSMYIGECKRWVQNGEQLLRASTQDLEKVTTICQYLSWCCLSINLKLKVSW